MNSKLIILVSALAAVFLTTAEAATPASPASVGAPIGPRILPVPPDKMDEFNAKTGGLVEPPATAKKLVFLDARAEDRPSLVKFTDAAERVVGVSTASRKAKVGEKDSPQRMAFDARKSGAGAVVLIYEREGDPTLQVFPEDAIVLLNMTPLKCEDANKYSRRFATEFWRSIAFAMGGYAVPSQMGSSLQALFSLKDFEELKSAGLLPQQITAIAVAKRKLGIYAAQPVPYSRACREGWAPPPTNDVQRALYKRFKDPTARFKEDFSR